MSAGKRLGEVWLPIATAPRDGTPIHVKYGWDNGAVEDGVIYAEHRQCMLGSRAGERGPGFVSPDIGYLPVEPTHWQPTPKENNHDH